MEEHHRRVAALLRLKALAGEAQSLHVSQTIDWALQMESRRVRGLSRTNSAVAMALVQRQEEDAAVARAEQAEWAAYTNMTRKRAALKAHVADAGEQLKKARQDLAALQSMKECQLAVKSFTPAALGDGHVRGEGGPLLT